MAPSANARDALDRIAQTLERQLRPLPIVGRVQTYAWGGPDYLRDLTGQHLPAGTPAAEWWIGAHPSAPALVVLEDGASCRLDALIARNPDRLLGHRVSARFDGRLPFLLKVLDVGQMLSIQAHPTRQQAEAGFAREQAAGTPVDAAHRTYRDDHHKPEAQVALTPFWMLFGFRAPEDMTRVLGERPELGPLADRLSWIRDSPASSARPGDIVRALFEQLMQLPQDDVDAMVEGLLHRLAPAAREGRIDRMSPDFWAVRAATHFRRPDGRHDRGVLVIYLMNLVSLAPGDASFFGAGRIHAYLEGVAVEIMANSDNVVRGGLTPKHVDVAELLGILDFEPSLPVPLVASPHGAIERRYETPAVEFALGRLEFSGPAAADVEGTEGPEALIVIAGTASLEYAAGLVPIARGQAVFVPAGLRYRLSTPGPALIFRAFVPA